MSSRLTDEEADRLLNIEWTPERWEACNVCGTTEVRTFESPEGVWWCDGCAQLQTDISMGDYDDE